MKEEAANMQKEIRELQLQVKYYKDQSDSRLLEHHAIRADLAKLHD
jgi:hypothetical protein